MDHGLKAVEAAEQRKYERMWGEAAYRERSPGERIAQIAWDEMKPEGTMCDFGCGTGRAANWFAQRGIEVTGFDIAGNAMTEHSGPFVQGTLWDMPEFGEFDYGYCCDVMEHLPPETIEASLNGIASRVRKAAFFQIALFECHMGKTIGEHLHLTVRPAKWWHAALRRQFASVRVLPLNPKYVIAVCGR